MDIEGGNVKKKIPLADHTESTINLSVNGKQYTVHHADPTMYLNEFLRCHLHLTGTKRLCAEGGCGSCVVAVSQCDPSVHPESIQAINSCMAPILSLDSYYVITVEGLGSNKDGFHEIQRRFASNFASQCGFCTPGFVMNGFSLLASDSGGKTMKEIEDSFDGNICRCTGYRPILDAMKSFAKECDPVDIEDIRSFKPCKQMCVKSCQKAVVSLPQRMGVSSWLKASSVLEVLSIIARCEWKSVRFVAGNTAIGVFKNDDPPDLYVDLKNLSELTKIQLTEKFVEFGASVTLTSMVKFFEQKANLCNSFQVLADHIKKVANVPVRNVATWAGNLMMKHSHPNFPSDIFIILETVSAKLNIIDVNGNLSQLRMREFLHSDMHLKVILSMTLPFSLSGEVTKTFKIMPRKQNSYAYVHAGFRANVDQDSLIFNRKPTICVGGMGLKSGRISEVEDFLERKSLKSYETFQDAAKLILSHLKANPENKVVDFNYCRNVTINLFYKFCVSLRGSKICQSISSARSDFERPVSSGKQSFHINNQIAPLNQPTERIEGKLQASGEVMFTLDLPPHPREAYASFVLSDQGNARLAGLDATEAMKCDGFIGIFSEKDIPGRNAFMHGNKPGEIFAVNKIEYAGQIVGMVVADSQRNADNIAKKVKVNYSHVSKPITEIEDAIMQKSFHSFTSRDFTIGNTAMAFDESDHVISGTIKSGSQHHIYMEAQNCFIVKEEHDYKVFSSTQCMRDVQAAVAKVLDINASRVNVEVNRVGGAFGGKFQYPAMIAGAVAVAVFHLDRPVRALMTLDDNLKAIGKRSPMIHNYKVGFTKEGYLKAIEVDVFCDTGCYPNCHDGIRAQQYMDNAYFCPNWKITVTECKTNTPFNTFFRGPGNIQSVIVMEEIIDQIAIFLGNKTPEEIKEINFYKSGQYNFAGYQLNNCLLHRIWQEIKIKADSEKQRAEVATFNKENRWRKRGIALMPLKYDHFYNGFNFSVLVSIYYADGSVAISHGGIEMGQGIHTRVRNFAASKLGIPVDLVSVKPTTTIASPNSIETGASVTSEMNCVAVYQCCEILLERIEPIRKRFPNATWKELIRECERRKIELVATSMFTNNEPYVYSSYGATVSSVEIDVLTGEVDVLRSDIMYDCGESINQGIDIGQVEGAFVQGMGYFLSEKVVYDPENGEQLTTNTWEYKPPMSKDIPIDMRVFLLHEIVNPLGFIRSKAVGEPALCMAASCLFAVKDAIKAARKHNHDKPDNFCLNAPATVDKIQSLCQVKNHHLFFSNETSPFR